ncbi:UTP:RNA uridylyltransferase 1 [Cucumis sativus]|uniref:RNA uridylyltransferase n=1 Tax=Cucumis sativus TaxID=3659 RepID=A0A0A0KBJ1_CUCSA|nr:UTP:RNA uridylyltransferase 1 [Cucumis sativus]KGN46224.1 hypothetical protein Csa_005271 [Cucumis sativus]
MAGDAGGDGHSPFPPPSNGGEFLLSLLQRPPNRQSHLNLNSLPHLHPSSSIDPAVAAVGPSLTSLPTPWPSSGSDLLYPIPLSPWSHSHQSLSTPIAPNYVGFQHLQQNPFPLPRSQFGGAQFAASQTSGDQIQGGFGGVDDFKRLGFPGNHDRANGTVTHNFSQHNQLENKLQFGSFSPSLFPRILINGNSSTAKDLNREVGFRESIPNGLNRNQGLDSHGNSNFTSYGNSNPNANVHSFGRGECDYSDQERGRVLGENYNFHPQVKASEVSGFMSNPTGGGHLDFGNIRKRDFEHGGNRERPRSSQFGEGSRRLELGAQLRDPVRPSRSDLQSALALNIEERVLNLDSEIDEGRHRDSYQGHDSQELDNIGEQLADSLLLEDEPDEKSDSKFIRREKDCRGNRLLTHRERIARKHIHCRGDIDMLTIPLLRIYESLIPPEEEKEKQRQLLISLEKLVVNEWPHAHLFLFGSCANSFGVSNSDVDVCLVLRDADIDKSEILLKLAEILQSANFQNVQALTRARVPIIKLKDPVTGVSCDICINNVLAVVNTKLLRDYAQIDVRLPQLAFIVKHWAKSRGVNETYQGTLSSYAYVLMCIHFLQHRDPPILPCLQETKIVTYHKIVDNIECAYFDQVEKLKTFGSDNKESVARLVWGFFHYWAYCHDYANTVVSVRTKNTVSKRAKDWTRRIGKDRHLICIEDPFETSHDLGRVVDKYSIKVLREEFERAATILQTYPNPCEKLFEPFVPS